MRAAYNLDVAVGYNRRFAMRLPDGTDSPRVIGNLIFGDSDVGTSGGWTINNNGLVKFAVPASTTRAEPQEPNQDQWHFQLTPYLRVAGISGRAGIGALSGQPYLV